MDPGSKPVVLTRSTFSKALTHLFHQDPELAFVIDQYGRPPLGFREPGFPSIVQIILEQQVSVASAKAAFDRLNEAITHLDPSQFLTLDDAALKAIGFSRQKTRYCRQLAFAIIDRELDLDELETLDNKAARSELIKMTGIGPWTADIYLLTALRRPDIWPTADLALAVATQKLKNLQSRPDVHELDEISGPWRPWRAVAARVLWNYYVSN